MIPYKSRSGKKSGVTAYSIGNDFIVVQFKDSEAYKYTYNSAGRSTIERMKSHAINQLGLSTFIAQNKPNFE